MNVRSIDHAPSIGRDRVSGAPRPVAVLVSWWLRYADVIITAGLFAAALMLYARTAAPGLLDGDEGEFQTNMARLGVSHTGYPLFFLLGKLWTLIIPVGTAATRANLFAAFWGAAAVAVLYILVRFLTRNRWIAVVAALLLAGSRVEWSQAIIPRPYTLNSFFVIVVTFLFFLWRAGKVDLTVPVFAFGLSLTNHRTMMWFGPAIAIFVLWHERGALFRPRRLLSLLIAFVLPLVLYGYVFWRGESDVGVEFHMKDFADMVLGGNAREWWRFGPLDWVVRRITDLYVPLLVEQFTPVGLIAGLAGAGLLLADRRPRGWPAALPPREVLLFLFLANVGNTAFCVFFDTIDVEKFFLASYITFLIAAGIGLAVVWDLARGVRWAPALRIAGQAVLYAVLLAGAAYLLVRNFAVNDWSGRTAVAATWQENLAQPLEEHALIVGPWESLTPLEYAMYVDGKRRDLERWKVITQKYLLDKAFYDSRQADIEREVRNGRPVYLTVNPAETETLGALADEFRLVRVGELWRVLDAPPQDTDLIGQLRSSKPIATFADGDGNSVELLGYGIHPTPALRAGDFGLATLYWRARQRVEGRLAVSFRLTDSHDHLISQRDSEPASGLRPTSGWTLNEIVQDDIGFIIPPDVPPGTYHLSLVVYNLATGETWRSESGIHYALNDLNIARTFDMPAIETLGIPHPLDVSLAPLRLRGYGLGAEQVKGGDLLDLSLWWQLDQPTAHGEQLKLTLREEGGRVTTLYEGAPLENYPAEQWGRAAVLRGRYALHLPLDATGSARLRVELNGQMAELAVLTIRPSGRTFSIPRIGHPLAARFGDSIQMLGYDLDRTNARPGETVRATLYWQAVAAPAQSYTIFVHALDPSGVLRGQKDALPRNGALPTDRWLPGEVIADTFDVTLASDAPAGTYRFEVGMYVPETGTRLAVVDAGGAPQADGRVLVGELNVTR